MFRDTCFSIFSDFIFLFLFFCTNSIQVPSLLRELTVTSPFGHRPPALSPQASSFLLDSLSNRSCSIFSLTDSTTRPRLQDSRNSLSMPFEKTNTQSPAMGTMQHARDSTQKTLRGARIPSPVMFLLVVLSSLGISSGLLALTSSIHRDELRSVGKPIDSWWHVGGLLAWRAFEVGLAWLLGYDCNHCFPYSRL